MEKSGISWDQVIAQLADGEDLRADQAKWAMGEILGDRADKESIKSFLLGVQAKVETAEEVQAFVSVMFDHCAPDFNLRTSS